MGRARWASREAVMAGVEPGAGGGEVVASAGAVCGAREEGLGMKRGPQCVATEQHEAARGGVGSPAASDARGEWRWPAIFGCGRRCKAKQKDSRRLNNEV